MTFHLTLLGPPTLWDADGRPVAFRTKKHTALVVLLCLDGRGAGAGVSRDLVTELLWPEAPPARGRHSLSQALTALRERFGGHAIKRGGDYLRLEADVTTDLDHPPSHDGAGQPRGHPLEGLDHVSGVAFAHWVDAARTRIVRGLRASLSREIEALRARGELAAVHERAAQLYEIDPRHHLAVHLLAEHAALGGDTDSAVHLIEDCLAAGGPAGGKHTAKLRRLLSKIRDGTFPPPSRPTGPPLPSHDVFVGRAEELAALNAWWSEVRETRLTTGVVTGPAGIGKSAMIRRFTGAVAADGHLVLSATCQQISREIPFAAVSELLSSMAGDPEIGGTDPHWLSEASRVAPFLRGNYPGIPEPYPASGETVRLSIAEACYRIIETVAAGAAVLVVIDDIHHLDAASRDVLFVMMRRARTFPLCIIGAHRTPEFEGDDADRRSATGAFHWHHTVTLPPLGDDEALRMMDAMVEPAAGGDEAIRRTIGRLSGGVPYLIEVLLADWRRHADDSLAAVAVRGGDPTDAAWSPSDTMRAAFSRHYRHLTTATRSILEVLAVAGRPLLPDDVVRMLDLPLGTVSQILLEGMTAGVLIGSGDAAAFTNEVHRTFVYHATPPQRRAYRHARLARLLLEAASDPPAAALIEASYHFVRAGCRDDAFDTACRGATGAMERGAPQEAERVLRAALDRFPDPPHPEATVRLAEALNLQGRFVAAIDLLEETKLPRDESRLRARVQLQLAQARVRGRQGSASQVHDILAATLGSARHANDQLLECAALLLMGEFAAEMQDWNGLEYVARSAAKLVSPTDTSAAALLVMGFCHLSEGRYADAYLQFTVVTQDLDARKHPSELCRALNGCASSAFALGEQQLALQHFRRAFDLAERLGDMQMMSAVASSIGTALTDYGFYNDALSWLDRSLDLNIASAGSRYEISIINNVADYYLVTGNMRASDSLINRAHDLAQQTGVDVWISRVLFSRADWLIASGQHDEACSTIEQAEDLATPLSIERTERSAIGFDSQQQLRLRRFRRWMEGDLEQALASPFVNHHGPMTLATLVELATFREWVAEMTGQSLDRPISWKQLIGATGLVGVGARLERLGIKPHN